MGQTDRFDLRYPEQGDEVDVPTDLSELAEDVEDWLSRLFEATSTTRPAGVPAGFMIRETDTGEVRVYNGSTWVLVGGAAGGGGGAFLGGGLWRAASSQSIPNTSSGPGTIVAFGTAVGTPTLITRTTQGAGHMFELESAGLLTGVVTGRWTTTTTAGVRDLSVWCDRAGGTAFDESLSHDGGGTVAGQPKGRSLPISRYLPAGTTLVVYAYNGTGATRTLEHNSGQWVSIDLNLIG